MHQQINLYQPVFRKPAKVFSALTLLQIGAAVLLLLLLVTGYSRWTLAGMRATADSLEQQLNTLQATMNTIEDAYDVPDTGTLDASIMGLQSAIEQRRRLLIQVEQMAQRNEGGFANRFAALAGIGLNGLWLEGISINSNREIELRGMTLDPKLVPVYIQKLEQQDQLAKTRFETVSMTRVAMDQPYIQFVLKNTGETQTWH